MPLLKGWTGLDFKFEHMVHTGRILGKTQGIWLNGLFMYIVMYSECISTFVRMHSCCDSVTNHPWKVSKVDKGCFQPGNDAYVCNIRTGKLEEEKSRSSLAT